MIRMTYTNDEQRGVTMALETDEVRREANITILGRHIYKEMRKDKDAKHYENKDAPALVERLRIDIITTAIQEMTRK